MSTRLQERAARFTVDPDLATLMPPLSEDERQTLERSILDEGVRDPLVLWRDPKRKRPVLIDGHHRYEIVRANALKFETREVAFPNKPAAIAWMLRTQLGRRNLSSIQRIEAVRHLEAAERKEAYKRRTGGVRQKRGEGGRVDERLGGLAGVSRESYRKASKVLDSGDKEIRAKMRSGDVSIHAAYQALNGRGSKPTANEPDYEADLGKLRQLVTSIQGRNPPEVWPDLVEALESLARMVREDVEERLEGQDAEQFDTAWKSDNEDHDLAGFQRASRG